MKILVTGADGLLGSYIVRTLLEKGHTVRVLIQPGQRAVTLEGLAVERLEGDLTGDPQALIEAARGAEGIVHAAAVTDMRADPAVVRRVNVEGTHRLLDAAQRMGARRFVFIGSASSFGFGPLDNPGDERSPFAPIYRGVPYMETKREAMDLVLSRRSVLDVAVVAPTFMLGEYDSRPSSGELIAQFLKRRLLSAPPGGRNFVHARDVASAAAAALERAPSGSVYVAGGTNLTYLDFFTRVARIAGADRPRRLLPRVVLQGIGVLGSLQERLTGRQASINRRMARLAVCGAWYDGRRAREELAMPQTPVDIAIEDALRGLRRYGHVPLPPQDFTGKVALITGGSRGLGFALAAALARAGAGVVITARGAERLEASRALLAGRGADVLAVEGDMAQPEAVCRVVDAALARFGRIDILVNNAGLSMRGHFKELEFDVCRRVIDTNLMSAVYATRAALPALIRSRGQVVFISSIAGLLGLPHASVYSAGKMALTGLAESLRLELKADGVHAGVVYLGFTEHDPQKRILAAEGSLLLPDRPAHHSQNLAARLIVEMIRKRKKRLVTTPVGKMAWIARRLSPSFVEWTVAAAQRTGSAAFKRFA